MHAKVLFIQFNNPGAYPPIINITRILNGLGWKCRFVGVKPGSTNELEFPQELSREVTLINTNSGLLRHLHFMFWVIYEGVFKRPHVIYVSDESACLAAFCLSFVTKAEIIYHEHDFIEENGSIKSLIQKRCRKIIVAKSSKLVVPSKSRFLETFRDILGVEPKLQIVFNCPSSTTFKSNARRRKCKSDQKRTLYYHGTLVPNRLPENILQNISQNRSLDFHVVGYFTNESHDYRDLFLKYSQKQNSNIHFHGARPHSDLNDFMSEADIGLCLLPSNSRNVNEKNMAGASNKVFDYLAAGLRVICPDTPQWRDLFSGIEAVAFYNDQNPKGFEHCLSELSKVLDSDLEKVDEKMRTEWNYEYQFAEMTTYFQTIKGQCS